jgi:quinol monooxygenase YgiN
MVQLTLRMTAMSGRAHELVQALQRRMRQMLPSRGCAMAHLSADVNAANVFWYCEDWKDAASLDLELRTERFSQLLEIMETSAQPPVLEFRVLAETRGLEYVAAARERHAPGREAGDR